MKNPIDVRELSNSELEELGRKVEEEIKARKWRAECKLSSIKELLDAMEKSGYMNHAELKYYEFGGEKLRHWDTNGGILTEAGKDDLEKNYLKYSGSEIIKHGNNYYLFSKEGIEEDKWWPNMWYYKVTSRYQIYSVKKVKIN